MTPLFNIRINYFDVFRKCTDRSVESRGGGSGRSRTSSIHKEMFLEGVGGYRDVRQTDRPIL